MADLKIKTTCVLTPVCLLYVTLPATKNRRQNKVVSGSKEAKDHFSKTKYKWLTAGLFLSLLFKALPLHDCRDLH